MAMNDPNQQQNQQSTQPGQNPRQLGTGFTNLQNIMQANTGNKLGQAVGSGIQQTGQQTTNALNSGVQDFNTQSQANALGTQAQKQDVQNTLNNAGNVNAQDVSNFAKYRSGQYTGPTDINNISNIQNQAQNAQKQGQEVGTAGGRQALLQQYAANPGSAYGSGQQNLDNLLLGATGGKDLQQARQSVSGLSNKVNSAQTTAQQQGQQLQNQAQGFGQQVTGQVQGAQSAIYNPAQQQAQEANIAEQKNQTAEQAAVQAAQNGQLSQDALTQLGLTSGQRTYGANLGQFIGYNAANEQANALNVMQQPQFQQYTGLQQLMGQTPSAAPQQAYQAGKTTYDQSGAQGAINTQQQAYNSAYQPAAQKLAAAQGGLQHWQQMANDPNGSAWTRMAAQASLAGAQQQVNVLQQQANNIDAQYGGTAALMQGS